MADSAIDFAQMRLLGFPAIKLYWLSFLNQYPAVASTKQFDGHHNL
jgi:hypothetical protein